MKNIIYFTTALDNEDYKEFAEMWDVKPNPSNQNFHNKFIRSLAITHHIDVISLRPFSRKLTHVSWLKENEKVSTSIHWHYPKVKRNRISRIFWYLKYSLDISRKAASDSIIFTDTINPNTLTCAYRCARKLKLPIVGLCTDSPSNITGTNRSYTTYLLSLSNKLNGYISLTNELGELFNTHNKPSLNIEGLVDGFSHVPTRRIDGNYFFFGGSLLKRYGVYDLIDAFKELNREDIKLVICGHHEEPNFKKYIKDITNIKYLDTIPVEEVLDYEAFALANINPRPYSEDLDRFSIPSKTLEYLFSGVPTISVKNSKLQKIFANDCIWAKSSSKEDLLSAMNKVLDLTTQERETLGQNSKEKVNNLYSLSQVNKQINQFLELL